MHIVTCPPSLEFHNDEAGIVFSIESSVNGAAPGEISVAKPYAVPYARVVVFMYQ